MPTEGAPAATAAKAYSIWTSFPEGLQEETYCVQVINQQSQMVL